MTAEQQEMDAAIQRIGRLCGDPECSHCSEVREMALKLHDSEPPLLLCQCSYCRAERHRTVRDA